MLQEQNTSCSYAVFVQFTDTDERSRTTISIPDKKVRGTKKSTNLMYVLCDFKMTNYKYIGIFIKFSVIDFPFLILCYSNYSCRY